MRAAWHPVVYVSCVVLVGGVALLGRGAQPGSEIAGDVSVFEIAPRYHLISDRTANLILLTTGDGALVAGVQRPSLIEAAKTTIEKLQAGPVRFAIAMEDTLSDQYEATLAGGDGGWGKGGAITLAHEQYRYRMSKFDQEKLGHAMPSVSFSHVVQTFLADEEIHTIHDRRGATDADLTIHFEREGLLYLGNTFTMDGYPEIHGDRRGTITGLIDTAESFLTNFRNRPAKLEPIVPGRGRVATMQDLQVYRDMLVTVRDRVRDAIAAGRTKDEVLAIRPTRDLDERWGHGPVPPERFVAAVYESLRTAKPATTAAEHHPH